VTRYQGRVSGPLLDRIDLHVHVHPVPVRDLDARVREGRDPGGAGAGSETVRARVAAARRIQTERFEGAGVHANAQMRPADLRRWCHASDDALGLLQRAVDRAALSARAYHRVLKVARTIADLAGSGPVRREHVAEALQFRSLDRVIA
jgi:magnesium chelatase family protein